jgi:nucleotide-binding universal stress UspA family protein
MQCDHICPISQMRKILLATDGTQYSEGAIREAINFSKKCSSKLYAVYVIEAVTDYEAFSPQKIDDALEFSASRNLESVKARALNEGLDCETIISTGDPHQCIVDEAAKRKADMIVIGRRGRTGLAKLLMGEVAAKVIGHAPCKTLVVPRDARIAFKTLLVATDGSAHSEAAVKEALGIAKCSGRTLIALSAARDQTELAEAQAHANRVAELGKQEGVTIEAVTPIGRSYDAIVETAAGRGVDLVIMGSYGKAGIRKALMGSSTEKVIGHAGCAVLIVKAQ